MPPNAPSLIGVVATGGTNAYLVGRVDGAPNQSITLQANRRPRPASCGTLVGGVAGGRAVTATTDSDGYFGVAVSRRQSGRFRDGARSGAAGQPRCRACLVSSRDNDSWPKAFSLDGSPVTAQDFIDAPGKARWYKFSSHAGAAHPGDA